MSTISASTTTTTAYKVTADTTGTLVLQTGSTPTTAVTIDTAQNVGVGVVPSAWSGVGAVLQVGTSAAIIGNSASSSSFISNAYYDGSAYKFIGAGFAARLALTSGAYSFQTSSTSGSAGGTVTFTAGMTLDASGRLGIGTASPSGFTTNPTALVVSSSTATSYSATVFQAAPVATLYGGGGSGNATGMRLSQGGSFELFFGGVQESGGAAAFVFQGYSGSAYAERARIDSSGNLLVGQTSGSYKLCVSGGVYFDGRKGTGYGSAADSPLGVFGSSNEDAVNSGAVYNMEWKISGGAGGQYWYSNYITRGGSRTLGAYCTGTTWTNASDIANKEEIAGIGYGLETVMASRPVDFRWKTMRDEDGLGKKDIGFIAQEMELLVPEVVTGDQGQKGISYGSLVAVAFKAIQEQQAIIETLTNRITALEAK